MPSISEYDKLGAKKLKQLLTSAGIEVKSKDKVADLAKKAKKADIDPQFEEKEVKEVDEKELSEGELMQQKRESEGLPVEINGKHLLEFYREGQTYVMSKEEAIKQGFITKE